MKNKWLAYFSFNCGKAVLAPKTDFSHLYDTKKDFMKVLSEFK